MPTITTYPLPPHLSSLHTCYHQMPPTSPPLTTACLPSPNAPLHISISPLSLLHLCHHHMPFISLSITSLPFISSQSHLCHYLAPPPMVLHSAPAPTLPTPQTCPLPLSLTLSHTPCLLSVLFTFHPCPTPATDPCSSMCISLPRNLLSPWSNIFTLTQIFLSQYYKYNSGPNFVIFPI